MFPRLWTWKEIKDTCHWHRCSGARIVTDDCEICLAVGHGPHFGYTATHTIAIEMGVYYWVFITDVSYSWTHVLDVIWHLHSVWFSRKQHERCGNHSLKQTRYFKDYHNRGDKCRHESSGEICGSALLTYITANWSNTTTVFLWQQKTRKYTPITCNLMSTCKPSRLSSRPWGQALKNNNYLPCPSEWGWKLDNEGKWVPLWSYLPEASRGCRELIKCGWKKTLHWKMSLLLNQSPMYTTLFL